MKHLALLSALILCALCPLGLARADDQFSAPKESLTFDGQTLYLAFENNSRPPGEHIKEYIADGEKLDSWTRLAAFHTYPQPDDPKFFAANLIRIMKQDNPDAQGRVIQNPTTGEVIVDFVTWDAGGAFAEFNVFRIAKNTGGGLVAEQYAVRDYKDVRAFLKNLGPLRQRLVALMAKDGLMFNR